MEMKSGDITLRSFELADQESLANLANNKKLWLNMRDRMPHPYTINDAKNFIEFALSKLKEQIFAIIAKDSMVGAIGLHEKDDIYRYNYEIGYWIGEEYWNQGFASTALKLMIEYAFNDLQAKRIEASVFDYNKASMHMLKKANFSLEGVAKQGVYKNGKFIDEYQFALINQKHQDL